GGRIPRSADVEQLDVEDQRRVGRDSAAGAARAVAELRGNHERALATDLHPGDALIPTGDHLPGAELELERIVAVARAVELLAVMVGLRAVVQPPGVVHRHALAPGRVSAVADLAIGNLQAGDVVHHGSIPSGGWGLGIGDWRERGFGYDAVVIYTFTIH